jgi:hypothetical protein
VGSGLMAPVSTPLFAILSFDLWRVFIRFLPSSVFFKQTQPLSTYVVFVIRYYPMTLNSIDFSKRQTTQLWKIFLLEPIKLLLKKKYFP